MKMNEKEINDLKENLILSLDNLVTSAKSNNQDTIDFIGTCFIKCFNDTEDFNENKELVTNLINDIQDTYNNDGYVLYKWDFETINNRKNMLVITINKIKTSGEKIKGKVENNLNRIIRKSRMIYDVLDSYKDSAGFSELELLTKNADELLAKCMMTMSDIDSKRTEEINGDIKP